MSVLSTLRRRLTKDILGGRFRNRKKAKTLSAESGHFVLEPLEPRLLLAADPLAIAGTVSALAAAADQPPTAALTAPAANTPLSGTVTVSATAADDVGVAGVQFLLDGAVLAAEDTKSP